MKRSAPMPRTSIKRKGWAPRPVKTIEGYTPRPRAVAVAVTSTVSRMVMLVRKDAPIQHREYMDLVRAMPCVRCLRPGPSQFCHSDLGKGTGIKTDCRSGWPGCPACHELVGSTGKLGKDGRRVFEAVAALATRTAVLEQGLWPASLPLWDPQRGGNA